MSTIEMFIFVLSGLVLLSLLALAGIGWILSGMDRWKDRQARRREQIRQQTRSLLRDAEERLRNRY